MSWLRARQARSRTAPTSTSISACIEALGGRERHVGALRIGHHALPCRINDEVHIFHWDRAEKHLIAEHERTGPAMSAAELDAHRADIVDDVRGAVRRSDFALFGALEAKLDRDVARNTEMQRAGIGERLGIDLRQLWPSGVDETQIGEDKTHRAHHSTEWDAPRN